MRTTTIDLARDDVRIADLVGRRAVFTASGGARYVGTLEPHPYGGAQMAVRLDSGQWGATGMTVEVVVEEVR